MRLKSVTIRNYRVHRDLTIALDESRTLIGGPNECGKSTIVEATHRALFLRSKVTGDAQKNMVSLVHPGHPEVDVTFHAAGSEYQLSKRFSGATGTTRLTQLGGQTWHGDDAETRLAALLKVEAVGGGRGVGDRVAQQWSHLWVWQCDSTLDPSAHANQQKESLLQRLQQTGGAAALQSEIDAQVAAHFTALRDAIFTQAGKPKAGSNLDLAETEASQAELNRQLAADRVEALRSARRDYDEASAAIKISTDTQQTLKDQLSTVELKLERVEELRRQEASEVPEANSASEKFQALQKQHEQILQLARKILELESALAPRRVEAGRLEASCRSAKQLATQAGIDYDRASDCTRQFRLRRDFAAACMARFEKEIRLQELLNQESQTRAHHEQLALFRNELARLPEITPARLKKLQKIELEISQSDAALKAMAAGIDVLSAAHPVQIGGVTLSAGQSQIVTEETEIHFAQSLRLRISPGGGNSLQEANKHARESRRQLRSELDELGITSVSEAAECLARRKDLAAKIENAEGALAALNAASLPEALAEARNAVAAATAELERRAHSIAGTTIPPSLAEARRFLALQENALEQAESAEAQAKLLRDRAFQSLATAEESWLQHQQAMDQQNNELATLTAQFNFLTQTHGNDETRVRALSLALEAKNAAEENLRATRSKLADLQPSLLEADRPRLLRACENATAARQDAETRRALALAALRSDGADDPEAALALASARAASAQAHLTSLRRKADAIQLLHELFLEEQRTLADQFTQPFAERISIYLQCIFGPGAHAALTLAENAFSGLQLVRPSLSAGAIPFETLSGGTREQVAAAVRLAMAEVLAADHDGTLPLVFDDAFSYSDPDRVQTLQRMLDLAASRGLQIIIFTCNPTDYAALGARYIQIHNPHPKLES